MPWLNMSKFELLKYFSDIFEALKANSDRVDNVLIDIYRHLLHVWYMSHGLPLREKRANEIIWDDWWVLVNNMKCFIYFGTLWGLQTYLVMLKLGTFLDAWNRVLVPFDFWNVSFWPFSKNFEELGLYCCFSGQKNLLLEFIDKEWSMIWWQGSTQNDTFYFKVVCYM